MKYILTFIMMVICVYSKAQTSLKDNSLTSRITLARQYLTGIGQTKDEKMAFTIYLKCAQEGSPAAMNFVGILYKEGIGIARNKNEGIKWLIKSASKGYDQSWYNLGIIYKDSKGRDRDYVKAFGYFSKAAESNDPQSIYAMAYMLYKGFGCTQNYNKAKSLFIVGALKEKPNSMYFLGLCFRNGYGVTQNTDSAMYWLRKSALKGYRMAMNELKETKAENENYQAKALASRLKSNSPKESTLNEYEKIESSIESNTIEGLYKGHLIRYDWSGKHAIYSANLMLEVSFKDGELTGKWLEADTLEVPFKATLTRHSMIFKDTRYSRSDHYSAKMKIRYNFEDAKLKWIQKGDSVYLDGNISMFSPQRNEPEKPIYVTLTKFKAGVNSNTSIKLTNDDGTPVTFSNDAKAYPNPFSKTITIDFEIKEACNVLTQIFSIDGVVLYTNKAGFLKPGFYRLPVQFKSDIPGNYIIKLQMGNRSKTIKLVKI